VHCGTAMATLSKSSMQKKSSALESLHLFETSKLKVQPWKVRVTLALKVIAVGDREGEGVRRTVCDGGSVADYVESVSKARRVRRMRRELRRPRTMRRGLRSPECRCCGNIRADESVQS
jgi:hypothetical protein